MDAFRSDHDMRHNRIVRVDQCNSGSVLLVGRLPVHRGCLGCELGFFWFDLIYAAFLLSVTSSIDRNSAASGWRTNLGEVLTGCAPFAPAPRRFLQGPTLSMHFPHGFRRWCTSKSPRKKSSAST